MEKKLHIIPHKHALSREDRMHQRGHKSLLIWFVGLSGSGKSTLAGALEKVLFEQGIGTYILDGDNIRSGLNRDLDFSEASRKENIRRIAEVARLLVDAGIVTLTAFISPFEAERKKVKELVGADTFVEVFVNCPLEVCEQRDVKGLYAKARAGEISDFTGISSPFEAPAHPDVEVNTDKQSIDACIQAIMQVVEQKINMN
jgi:adenylylsulfate kinase